MSPEQLASRNVVVFVLSRSVTLARKLFGNVGGVPSRSRTNAGPGWR
jgi:hypothetical protein